MPSIVRVLRFETVVGAVGTLSHCGASKSSVSDLRVNNLTGILSRLGDSKESTLQEDRVLLVSTPHRCGPYLSSDVKL